MVLASTAQSGDFTSKVVLLVIGAAVGFVFSLLSDRLKARREPKKRISYDMSVGATLASVPHDLAEKVTVLFSGAAVEGQLYEVTCRIENTGNQVVKQQFLRFSFPSGVTVLDAFLAGDPPQEIGVGDAPLEIATPGDHRWIVAHLERGQTVEFGLLVCGPTAVQPTLHGYNAEGGVELIPRAISAVDDDASHVRPLVIILLLGWMLPSLPFPGFNDLASQGFRLALLVLAVPHLQPVGRLIGRRAAQWGADPIPADLSISDIRTERLFVATRGGSIAINPDQGESPAMP